MTKVTWPLSAVSTTWPARPSRTLTRACWCPRRSASGAAACRLDRLIHDRRIEPCLGHLAAGLGDPGRQLFPAGPRRGLPELKVRFTAQQDGHRLAMFGQPHLIAGGRLLSE